MPDDTGASSGTDPSAREPGAGDGGLESSRGPDPSGAGPLAIDSGYAFGDDDHELAADDAGAHGFRFAAPSDDLGELGVDLSPGRRCSTCLMRPSARRRRMTGPSLRARGPNGRTP